MNGRLTITLILIAVSWCAISSASETIGAAVNPNALTETARNHLIKAINEARDDHPETFTAVDQVILSIPSEKAASRNSGTSATAILESIGPDALFPMLDLLVHGIPSDSDYDLDMWSDIQAILIDAVGRIRDPRSIPILTNILESGLVDQTVQEQTVAALARLESDEVIDYLFSVLDDPSLFNWKRRAILWGIGFCPRAPVAERLAMELRRYPESEDAVILLDSLGKVGNWGVWAVPTKNHKNEESTTKRVAVEAALWTYLEYSDSEIHHAAKRTILMVCDHDTPRLIRNAKGNAPRDLQPALDDLAQLWLGSSSRSGCTQ